MLADNDNLKSLLPQCAVEPEVVSHIGYWGVKSTVTVE